MVDEVQEFPTILTEMFRTVVPWEPKQRELKRVVVTDRSETWLIKVHKDHRCPVCGEVVRSKANYCDPRPGSDCDE